MLGDDATVGPGELKGSIFDPLHAEAAFVHQAVMMAAQQHEVVERGFAAVGPVLNMMGIDEAMSSAPRKAAAAVAEAGPSP